MCIKSSTILCRIGNGYGYVGRTVGRLGLDLGDGGPTFLDLRFADDILIFATTYIDAGLLLDERVVCLSQVGLVLNTDKTKVMPTEAQPPSLLSTPAGLRIEILDQQSCHKWLGCMLSMPTVIKKRHDVDQLLQAASKPFFCHRATLCDRNVSLGKRLRYFDAVISPVAVFVAGHRTMYKTDLMFYFGSCFVALSVLLQVWIGPVHGMKSNMIRTVESMNLRPFIASNYGQNDVSSNIGIQHIIFLPWKINGVVGQPTYGTLSSKTSADGKAFNIGHWNQEITKAGWQCSLISFIL